MKTYHFRCGCYISYVMLMDRDEFDSVHICEKHIMNLLGFRSKQTLADKVWELAGGTKKESRYEPTTST